MSVQTAAPQNARDARNAGNAGGARGEKRDRLIKGGSVFCGDGKAPQRLDIAAIDPEALRRREDPECEQPANRSNGAVAETLIAGQPAWRNNARSADLGRKETGKALRFCPRA